MADSTQEFDNQNKFLDFKIEKSAGILFETGKIRSRVYFVMLLLSFFSVIASTSSNLDSRVTLLGATISISVKNLSLITLAATSLTHLYWSQLTATARIYQEHTRVLLLERYGKSEWAWYLNFPSQDLLFLFFPPESPVRFVMKLINVAVHFLLLPSCCGVVLMNIYGNGTYGVNYLRILYLMFLSPYILGVFLMIFSDFIKDKEYFERLNSAWGFIAIREALHAKYSAPSSMPNELKK